MIMSHQHALTASCVVQIKDAVEAAQRARFQAKSKSKIGMLRHRASLLEGSQHFQMAMGLIIMINFVVNVVESEVRCCRQPAHGE
jgi:hypothetical protein